MTFQIVIYGTKLWFLLGENLPKGDKNLALAIRSF